MRVLVGIDGSPAAQTALDLVSVVRVVSIAELTFPWWVGLPQPGAGETAPFAAEAAEASRAAHGELAATMAAALVESGVRAEALTGEGDPAGEIVRAAADWGADLIVMGTHGRSRLGRLLIGSVARNVLHHAGCSVLIARDPFQAPGGVTPA